MHSRYILWICQIKLKKHKKGEILCKTSHYDAQGEELFLLKCVRMAFYKTTLPVKSY